MSPYSITKLKWPSIQAFIISSFSVCHICIYPFVRNMFLKDVTISPFCLCGLMHIVFAQFCFSTEILKMHLCLHGEVYPLIACCCMVLADSLIMSSNNVLSHLKKWSFFSCLLLFTLMHEYYCVICF